MRPEIRIEYRGPGASEIDAGSLERALAATFVHTGQRPTGVTLLVASGEAVQDLNRRFLGRDRPTDVLAFPASDETSAPTQGYLGDIVLSGPQAAQQARDLGHSFQDELILLSIHGLLHLLGFDDSSAAVRHAMWQAQDVILDGLGLSHIKTTEA